MATVLDELGAFLVAEGVVTAIGTDLFLEYMPNTPNACLLLRQTPGRPPVGGFGTAGIRFEYPNVQVVARGVKDDEQTPRALAESAYTKLAEVQAVALSGTNYLTVQPLQAPSGVLGDDELGRPRISFNCNCGKELS